MEAEMVPSLSPLLQGADQWNEVLLLLPLLIALEAVLSADNAIALAAISRRLHDPVRQRQALNLGLLLALVLRMGLILAARWVLNAWPLQLAAAAYLLWLCGRHLLGLDDASQDEASEVDTSAVDTSVDTSAVDTSAVDTSVVIISEEGSAQGLAAANAAATDPAPAGGGQVTRATQVDNDRRNAAPPIDNGFATAPAQAGRPAPGIQQGHTGPTLTSIALTLALTDLAFSLDSVAAAVAVTDRLALVMAGGLLGVLALRLTAGLFVRWLELFSRLETAGYLAVGLVGIRLMLRLLLPDLEVPEWLLLLLVAALFLWGFSKRSAGVASAVAAEAEPAAQASDLVSTGSEPPPTAQGVSGPVAPDVVRAAAALESPLPVEGPLP